MASDESLSATTEKLTAAPTSKVIRIKPYSITELSKIYGVCNRTFKKWVDEFDDLGEKIGRYYKIPQVKMIFERLMLPTHITIEPETLKAKMDTDKE